MPRTLAISAILLLSACMTTAQQHQADDVVEAPFELSGNHIMVSVNTGGRDYIANYDSGSEISAMSSIVAQELGIQVEATSEPGHGFGGDVESGRASNVRLQIGSGSYTFENIGVIDFTPMLGPNDRLDFALGQTLFPDHVVEIDLDRRLLRWTPRGRFNAPSGATLISMGHPNGALTVPMHINGVEGVACVDTGSGVPATLSAAFAQRVGLDPSAGATRQGSGAGGRFVSRLTSVPTLSLAGVEMRDAPLEIYDGSLPCQGDINVGTPVLFRYRLALDYAGRRIWLTPSPTAASAPFRRDLRGMVLRREGTDRLTLTFVSSRGPAHDSGLVEGDQITAIDGIAVANWPSGRPFLPDEEGAAHSLTLSDGRSVTLTLGRYY